MDIPLLLPTCSVPFRVSVVRELSHWCHHNSSGSNSLGVGGSSPSTGPSPASSEVMDTSCSGCLERVRCAISSSVPPASSLAACVCKCVCMCVYMYTRTCIYMCVNVCEICVKSCTYTCTYNAQRMTCTVYMYIYIYIHIVCVCTVEGDTRTCTTFCTLTALISVWWELAELNLLIPEIPGTLLAGSVLTPLTRSIETSL